MTRLNPGKLAIARGLVAKGFSQNAFARAASGRQIGFDSRNATRFCAIGAIMRVETGNTEPYQTALGRKSEELFGRDIFALNDGPNGQAKVLAVYDALIKEHSA